ncbi:MAG: response regulator [Rickettsiales bacterium]
MTASILPTILLVEDSVDDYKATERSFRKNNFRNPLQWCKSGQDALDYLKHEGPYAPSSPSSAKDTPALILLDLNMPGLDGKQTLASVKKDERLRKIPVVILTTSTDERDVEQCYSLGASTYIQKPVDFDGLIEAIKRLKEYWFGIAVLPRENDNA